MWIHISEIEEISKIVKIDRDIIIGVTDEEEPAWLEIDDDYTMIVLDIPISAGDGYETYPFTIIYNEFLLFDYL